VRLVTALALGSAACSLTADLDRHRASRHGADAGLPRPCAPGAGHLVCADFDDGGLDDQFTGQTVSPGASLVFDDAHVSPPRSVRATVPAIASGFVEARLRRLLPPTAKRVHASFRLFACETSAATDSWEIVKLEVEGSGAGFKIVTRGQGRPPMASLTFDGTAAPYPLDRPFPTARWVDVAIDLVVHPTAGEVRVVYDGDVTVLDQKNVSTQGPTPLKTFYVGLWTNSLAAPCTALLDDVIVDVE